MVKWVKLLALRKDILPASNLRRHFLGLYAGPSYAYILVALAEAPMPDYNELVLVCVKCSCSSSCWCLHLKNLWMAPQTACIYVVPCIHA
jgi:hypothetical protein